MPASIHFNHFKLTVPHLFMDSKKICGRAGFNKLMLNTSIEALHKGEFPTFCMK